MVEALTGTPGFASSRITFASASGAKKNKVKEIYVSDIDGANARQLTQDKSLGYGPKFSPDGGKIVYSSDKSGYRDTYVIDLGSKKRTCVAQFPGQNTGAAFSPDGSLLASASYDGTVRFLRVATGEVESPLTGIREGCSGVAFAPDGRTLAVACEDGTVRLWNLATRREMLVLMHGRPELRYVAFSPDARTLVSVGRSEEHTSELSHRT